MGKYKVYYFNARGRAEIIRMTLKAAKQDFEDIRFEREEWPEYKKKSPTGQAPWIETPDGKVQSQSIAIARAIAHEHGLLGKTAEETYFIERSIDQVDDLRDVMYKLFFAPNDEARENMKKEITEGKGETVLTLLDKNLDEGEGLICKGRVTLADLVLMNLHDYVRDHLPDLYEKHPKLQAHNEHVCKTVPELGDWIKERPKTAM